MAGRPRPATSAGADGRRCKMGNCAYALCVCGTSKAMARHYCALARIARASLHAIAAMIN